jgi:hypothetical protein
MKLLLVFGMLLAGTASAASCDALSVEQVDKEVLAFAEASLMKFCPAQMDRADSVDLVKACVSVEKIDQGSRDFYYQLTYRFERDSHPPRYASLHVGKYDISNPAIPSIELLGISGFCKN